MATPDDGKDPIPDDPESLFLTALWDCLGDAYQLSIDATVIRDLRKIQGLCEQAAALIRTYCDVGGQIEV